MTDATDPRSQGGQHNRGPGVFIAGNVYGDVNNHQTPRPDHGRDDESPAPREQQRNATDRSEGNQPEEENEVGPGGALVGWICFTVLLFGMSATSFVMTFMPRPSAGERVVSVLCAVFLALSGLVPLAFAFMSLAEVCAAGTANAADSARKRWAQGQRAAALLNLRYAVAVARVASFSAVRAGFIAGLFGLLAIGKKAADQAHAARELAEFEIAKTRSMLGENLDEG